MLGYAMGSLGCKWAWALTQALRSIIVDSLNIRGALILLNVLTLSA